MAADPLRGLELVCPLCRGELDRFDDRFDCGRCVRTYPLCDGIPDFRVFPDRYLSFEEDRRRTAAVLGVLHQRDLESLLEYYWSLSDCTPPELRRKFVGSALRSERKARLLLRTLSDGTFGRLTAPGKLLDLGSGTGGLLAVAAGQGIEAVGADIAMRWLHVSRRRFLDRGIAPPPLVCCCAEFLPFRSGSFDTVVTASTLEFASSRHDMLAECGRTLRGDGSLLIQTVNRYSLAASPYVDLWGVGFLARAWQGRYVRWRRNAAYENVRPLSLGELSRLAARRFRTTEFAFSDIDNVSLQQFPWTTRAQVRVYRQLQRLPAARGLLRRFGPEWIVKLSGPIKQAEGEHDRP